MFVLKPLLKPSSQDEPVQILESVGCVLNLKQGLLRNKLRRVWRFHMATLALLRRRKLKGKIIQIWAGHFTALCSHTPWGLSSLQHTYRFIEASRDRRIQVWASVRRELKIAASLIWMTWRNLAAPFAEVVETGDASTSGFALTSCRPGVERIKHACATHEKWRFFPCLSL